MSWTPGWELQPGAVSSENAPELLESAKTEFDRADTPQRLWLAIDRFEAASEADPDSLEAATGACEAWCLLGAAYSPNRSAKRHAYTRAVQYCERAMATNPSFAGDGDQPELRPPGQRG